MDKNWKKWLFIITAIVGVLTTIELVHIFYNANFVPDAVPSFCAISEKIDCDAVARSPYAIFLGVPFAIWGLLFYIFILFIAFVDKLKEIQFLKILEVFKNPQSYLYCLSFFATFVSILLAGVSNFVLQKACLLCYVTYVLNAILLFAIYDKKGIVYHVKKSFDDFKEGVSVPYKAILLSFFVFVFSGLLIYVNIDKTFTPKSPLDFKLEKKYKTKKYGNILGSPKAKVIIHEYTDFQCPFCAISNAMMVRIAGELDNVMIIHHDYPLDSVCNPNVPTSVHKHSCSIASYSLASKYQGKYWDFNILLFENSRGITEKKILELAEQVGMDARQLRKDAYSQAVKDELNSEIDKAQKLGINATPTLRMGMKKHEGLMPYYELRQKLIDAGARVK